VRRYTHFAFSQIPPRNRSCCCFARFCSLPTCWVVNGDYCRAIILESVGDTRRTITNHRISEKRQRIRKRSQRDRRRTVMIVIYNKTIVGVLLGVSNDTRNENRKTTTTELKNCRLTKDETSE